jgi:hypothetical protein
MSLRSDVIEIIRSPMFGRVTFVTILLLAVLFHQIYGLWWFASRMPACETQVGERIEVVPAYTLEFRGTLCSGFGATYTIDMFGLDRRLETEGLLFSYGPFDASPPQVSAVGPNRIRVSLGQVSQVHKRVEKWHDLEIEYDIGRAIYSADQPLDN